MDFGLAEEQRLLQDTFRSYLAEQLPIERVRAVAAGEDAGRAEVWRALAELGAAGVLIPEKHGGSGLGLLDAALVAEELGRAATPAPFLGTAVMAPVALVEAGSEDAKSQWLPRLASGELRVGVAVTEAFSRREGAGVALRHDKLEGKCLLVEGAPGAELLLVAVSDTDLALVTADAAGVRIEALSTVDATRPVAEVVFSGTSPAALLPGALERTLDAGRAILAADLLGASEEMLDQAVAYAKERKQFSRPIGSFQAVKHLCAEMVAALEPARSMLWYAAHAFDALPDEAALQIAHTKAHLAEVATGIAKTSTEVHGGIGFTDEQNLHVWFKRIGLDRQLLGGPDVMRERAAALQGW